MSKMALAPCLVCGKELENVVNDAENQPYKGTAFTTAGHYGSTAFDPMNGSILEINICDECLVSAGEHGHVLWRREANALVDNTKYKTIIGWITNPNTPYVPWQPHLDHIEEGHLEDDRQDGLVTIPVDSKQDLMDLIETHGLRTLGGVKLNGGFTPDDMDFLDDENKD